MVQVSRRSAFRFSSSVSAGGKSYLKCTLFATQYLPTASKLASDMGNAVWPGVLVRCNQGHLLSPPFAIILAYRPLPEEERSA